MPVLAGRIFGIYEFQAARMRWYLEPLKRYAVQGEPLFAQAVEEALEEARAEIELEIQRRGQEGFLEPVYQKGVRAVDHDGKPASIRRFSDNLLLARARAMMPDRYSEKHQHQHDHQHNVRALVLMPSDLIVLSTEHRRQLREILNVVSVHRGEIEPVEGQSDGLVALPAPRDLEPVE